MSASGSASLPISLDEFEAHASRVLPRAVFDYYAGGAHDEHTLRANRRAFGQWILRPRVLRDVSTIDLACTLLSRQRSRRRQRGKPDADADADAVAADDAFTYVSPTPLIVAPSAQQCMAHPDGERATARACAQQRTVMTLSTISTTSIEDVAAAVAPAAAAAAAAPSPRWFQLYVFSDPQLTMSFVRRAERAGYTALVVTVDTPYIGVRDRDVRNDFRLPARLQLANFDGSLRALKKRPIGVQKTSPTVVGRCSAFDWRALADVQAQTSLPIILKGVLTVEDAQRAVQHGVRAIIVSNHGGRQLDGVPASLDALPAIAEAVGNSIDVYFDGGVRRGTDVFTALALGAHAVLIGRSVLYGLAHSGQEGVERVLSILMQELELCMSLMGCRSLAEINRSCIMHRDTLRSRI